MLIRNGITKNPMNKITTLTKQKNSNPSNVNIRFYDRYWSAEILYISNNGRFISKQRVYLWFLENWKIYNRKWRQCWWLSNWVIRDKQWYTVAFKKWANDWISPLFPIPWLPPYIWYIPIAPQKPIKYPWVQYPFKRYGWSTLSPLTIFENE
jgi:hypothetical protein